MLSAFLKGSRFYFLLTVFSTVMIAFSDMLLPQIIRVTIDSVLGSSPPDVPQSILRLIESLGGAPYFRDRLWLVAMLIMAVTVFSVVFRYIFRAYNTIAAETLVKTMRNSLFHRIEHLPFAWHMKH